MKLCGWCYPNHSCGLGLCREHKREFRRKLNATRIQRERKEAERMEAHLDATFGVVLRSVERR